MEYLIYTIFLDDKLVWTTCQIIQILKKYLVYKFLKNFILILEIDALDNKSCDLLQRKNINFYEKYGMCL